MVWVSKLDGMSSRCALLGITRSQARKSSTTLHRDNLIVNDMEHLFSSDTVSSKPVLSWSKKVCGTGHIGEGRSMWLNACRQSFPGPFHS